MCLLLCVWKKNVSNSHKTLQPLSLNDHKKTSQWPCSKSKLKQRVKVTSFANIGIEKKIFEEFLLLLRFCCMHFKCQDYPTEATYVKKLGYRHWDMWRNWDIANTLTKSWWLASWGVPSHLNMRRYRWMDHQWWKEAYDRSCSKLVTLTWKYWEKYFWQSIFSYRTFVK